MSDESQSDDWFDDEFEEKSKSQLKREINELKELGRTLVEMPLRDLKKIDIPDNIYEAVIDAQDMSKGALKRQIGFIGGLIAKSDYEALQQSLTKFQQAHLGEVQRFHQFEQWRDRLIAGDGDAYGELKAQYEEFDIQHARQLARNAKREADSNKAPKSARLLFKYLQSLS